MRGRQGLAPGLRSRGKKGQNSMLVSYGRHFVMRVGRIRLLLILMLLSLGLWIVFGKVVVPPLIESAYRGESWSFLNGAISRQAVHPVRHYLQVWGRVTTAFLVSSLGFLLIMLVISSPAFIRKIVGEATPGSLGAIRLTDRFVFAIDTGRVLSEKKLEDRRVTDSTPSLEPDAVKDGDGVPR
jgi:hypothetical protein